MPRPSQRAIVTSLLDRHGRTFATEVGIRPLRDTPSPLYRLLCASLLSSARISSEIAVAAARALVDQGWTTPAKLAASDWGAPGQGPERGGLRPLRRAHRHDAR